MLRKRNSKIYTRILFCRRHRGHGCPRPPRRTRGMRHRPRRAILQRGLSGWTFLRQGGTSGHVPRHAGSRPSRGAEAASAPWHMASLGGPPAARPRGAAPARGSEEPARPGAQALPSGTRALLPPRPPPGPHGPRDQRRPLLPAPSALPATAARRRPEPRVRAAASARSPWAPLHSGGDPTVSRPAPDAPEPQPQRSDLPRRFLPARSADR